MYIWKYVKTMNIDVKMTEKKLHKNNAHLINHCIISQLRVWFINGKSNKCYKLFDVACKTFLYHEINDRYTDFFDIILGNFHRDYHISKTKKKLHQLKNKVISFTTLMKYFTNIIINIYM